MQLRKLRESGLKKRIENIKIDSHTRDNLLQNSSIFF